MSSTILSLFDYTGAWSAPYRRAGYTVIQVDIKLEVDILSFDYLSIGDVHGILAAPPCDHIAGSGARWWKEKDTDGRTAEHLKLYDKTWEIIRVLNPRWWALENPVGRLLRLRPQWGKPAMYFHPYEYAGYAENPDSEAYTKRTCLWGTFNPLLPRHPIQPVLGSKMHLLPPSEKRKELRSITPSGFARAFFLANP